MVLTEAEKMWRASDPHAKRFIEDVTAANEGRRGLFGDLETAHYINVFLKASRNLSPEDKHMMGINTPEKLIWLQRLMGEQKNRLLNDPQTRAIFRSFSFVTILEE